MEIQSPPNLVLRRRFARVGMTLLALAGLSLLAVGFLTLEFNPPVPPTPPGYRLIPGAAPLQFYRTDCSGQDDRRIYGSRFSKNETCHLVAVFDLPQRPADQLTNLTLRISYYRSDGSLAAENSTVLDLEPSGVGYVLNVDIGWDEPGHWLASVYHVVVYLNDQPVAEGKLEIVEP